jgi:EAL domain-containing protein (putative c-di-GMP-specific phosphodiesterase class I)
MERSSRKVWSAANAAAATEQELLNDRDMHTRMTREPETGANPGSQIEGELRNALEAGDLDLEYQPVSRARDGRVVSVEAQLRCRHPQWRSALSAQLVRIAEEAGLMPRIGEWILSEALRQLAAWRAQGWRALRVAVSVSPAQLAAEDFADQVARAISDTSVPPQRLELAIVDSTRVHEAARVADSLIGLRRRGVSWILDHFGVGYSSLDCLRRYPVSRIKIDRSFIHAMASSREDAVIVRTMVAMAHCLGIETIADGVETRAQAALLTSYGCDAMQGKLVGVPQPAHALGNILLLKAPLAVGRAGHSETIQP